VRLSLDLKYFFLTLSLPEEYIFTIKKKLSDPSLSRPIFLDSGRKSGHSNFFFKVT
jgi:hypothetical protein